MSPTVRPAREDDRTAISAFTTGTFAWGDYIPRVLDGWMADPNGVVLVVADAADQAIAMARGTMLSTEEAWAQGARVHPDHRRRGLASLLSDELDAWALERGARVIRLLVEDDNDAAIAQVRKTGMRPVSGWVMAERAIGPNSPVPQGNGGRRVPSEHRLRRVGSAEAQPAFLAWMTGDLVRPARQLFPTHWSWRRLIPADLEAAARRDALWQAPSGYAMAALHADTFEVEWIDTTAGNAYDLTRALVDAALDRSAERLAVFAPRLEWLSYPLRRLGCDLHRSTVYARALG